MPDSSDNNFGHEELVKDLTELLNEALAYEFDDFRNDKYAMPKVELRKKFIQLADNVRDGKYDQ